jgi:hypothetical protein
MIVKELEKMETIVNNNKTLSWDGYDVLYSVKTEKARTSPQGVRIGSSWFIQKRYTLSRDGWDIPTKFVD